MDEKTIKVRYRAVCENDDFTGPWRTDIEHAKQDARDHRKQPGNEYHVTRIVTEEQEN